MPQTGLLNRTVHYAPGKCLGGSSGRNYLLYQRATVGSFDEWAKEVRDASYEWQSVLPYYQKSAHYTPANTTTRAANSSRGTMDETAVFAKMMGPSESVFRNMLLHGHPISLLLFQNLACHS